MNKPMNTTIDFEFYDGSKVTMTLTFYKLYQLKSKNQVLYNKYNRIMTAMSKETGDELDTISLLYVAYVCANMDSEDLLTEEEFIEKCGFDRIAVGNAVRALTQPKKQ